jgi:hypothetical protein
MARIVAVGLACLVAGWQVITVAAAEARYTREGFSQLLDAWQASDCR